jgi:chromate reductase
MKAVGIMGASPGLLGTSRAQYHLRQIMVSLNAYVMTKPEIMISQVNTKFDEAGNLTDKKTGEHILRFIESLVTLSNTLKQK